MSSGTGLSEFAQKYPDKFYDVGIAEEHAVVFGTGLAASGMKVIVAIYATFMQRALDCVFHDACLQNLPIVFCLDRAGIVEDGPTHHGIHELAFLKNLPNITIMSPANEIELEKMLTAAIEYNGPVVIRYPRGYSGSDIRKEKPAEIKAGKSETVKDGNDLAIWATGREVYTALKVAEQLEKDDNLSVAVINTRFIKPFDTEKLLGCAGKMPVATLEDCQISAGLGGLVDELLINRNQGLFVGAFRNLPGLSRRLGKQAS